MRRPRSFQPGAIYHVIARFVAQEYFVEGDQERRAYLCVLGQYLEMTDWRCFSYAVMSNHIHLGMLAGNAPLSSWARGAHGDFAQWINERRERIGAVFTRGPTAIGVRAEGAARLIAYIHLNPVRAGVVSRPADSDWTSHRAYLGQAYKPSWLDVDLGLELASLERASTFDGWVANSNVARADVEAMRVEPRRLPGRPRNAEGGNGVGPHFPHARLVTDESLQTERQLPWHEGPVALLRGGYERGT